jgi:hypothetical protein
MSQRIADGSAKVVQSFYPLPRMTDHVFFGLFRTIELNSFDPESSLLGIKAASFEGLMDLFLLVATRSAGRRFGPALMMCLRPMYHTRFSRERLNWPTKP